MTRRRFEEVFTDVEMMLDGSARWLWQVRDVTLLISAGVSMSRFDAEAAAGESLKRHQERLIERERAGWGTDTLNLDELERMDREDRAGRGADRGEEDHGDGEQGHTLIV